MFGLQSCFILYSFFSMICQSLIIPDKITTYNPKSLQKPDTIKPVSLDSGTVLSFVHPETKCKVHLVGVSHGSEASASLVKNYISDVKPSAVVLELCEDRYYIINVNANMMPQKNLINKYNLKDMKSKTNPKKSSQSSADFLLNVFKFAKEQGLAGGVFVILGLFIGTMQKLLSSGNDDEFTTAIRVSNDLNIPVRLGDAPQTDTLRNISNLISLELFNPVNIFDGVKSLAFGSLGLCAASSNPAPGYPSNTILQKSNWLNIPLAYIQNAGLRKSLMPLLTISFFLFGVEQLPLIYTNTEDLLNTHNFQQLSQFSVLTTFFLSTLSGTSTTTAAAAATVGEVSQYDLPTIANTVMNIFSLLLLVRLTKVVGVNRDAIIAEKLLGVCREFQGGEVVAVVGMLHCNGIARWLLSGQDPLQQSVTNEGGGEGRNPNALSGSSSPPLASSKWW